MQDADANPRPKRVPFTIPTNEPSDEKLVLPTFKCILRPEQKSAVLWALNQENNPKVWEETETAEAPLDVFGYRLEARAVAKTELRGGLLAFEVGFGKTPVVLALAEAQKDKDKKFAAKPIPDSIPLKATVVFVPHHLVGQVWNFSF